MRPARPAAITAAALLFPAAALAQLAPEAAPVPTPSPAAEEAQAADSAPPGAGEDEAEAEPADPAGEADEARDAEPDQAEDAEAGEAPDAEADEAPAAEAAPMPPELPPEPPFPERIAESELDLGICLGRLESLGTVYERVDAISDEAGACGIVNPVRVSEIVPGVALAPSGIMRCEAAAALAEWVARFVLPASTLLSERGRLVEVAQGSTYVCRRIGNGEGGDLSEHAFGNAIDVMGFGFAEGAPIPVEPREREGTAAEAFQRTVRAAACLSFGTVLGPGVEAHEDHLHLDDKSRESGYRYCR